MTNNNSEDEKGRGMTVGRLAGIVGTALAVMVSNVAVTILYMIVYGYLIDPGHDQQYYDEHVQAAAPFCSIVAGIPLMFAAGWILGSRMPTNIATQSAIGGWIVYVVIDFTVILLAGFTARIAILFTISFATKLLAIYYGARFSSQRRERNVSLDTEAHQE